MGRMIGRTISGQQRHQLDKRLEAAITVTEASPQALRDLAESAGITAKLPTDLLRVKLYWHIIDQGHTVSI